MSCKVISGFNPVRSDINGPNLRGLCLFVRRDFHFSVIDVSEISHYSDHSVEIQGVSVQCSLEELPRWFCLTCTDTQTLLHLFHFFAAFFLLFQHKYAILVDDFINAHHPAWDDGRQNRSGEYIFRNLETFNVVILNDGTSTYIPSPGSSSSIIDLTFVTRDLAALCEVVTGTDSCGSDHFLIHITIKQWLPLQGPISPTSVKLIDG